MADDAFAAATARLLAQDPEYRSLFLATRRDVPEALLAALAGNDHVTAIHFEMTKWDDAQCEALARFGLPPRATELYLMRNAITHRGIASLARLLPASRLRSLNLSCNPLLSSGGAWNYSTWLESESAFRALGSSIPPTLETLNLNETETAKESGDPQTEVLVEALATRRRKTGRRLKVLYLQGNSIDDATAVRLAPALAGAGIEEVYLGKNKIADEGGAALAAFARSEHGPRKLSLYGNQLGDAAAASFADAIAADPILELLNLSHNAIGDTGAGRLSEGLGTNSRLRKLDVAVNKRMSDAAKNILSHSMSPEKLAKRSARAFKAAALQLLLWHARRRLDAEGEVVLPLRSLPHGVLTLILDLARPGGFPRIRP